MRLYRCCNRSLAATGLSVRFTGSAQCTLPVSQNRRAAQGRYLLCGLPGRKPVGERLQDLDKDGNDLPGLARAIGFWSSQLPAC